MIESKTPTSTQVLVVGAGPAGSAAATWAAKAGHQVLLADAAHFPRDKACGDGLTPRAVAELRTLGLTQWLDTAPQNWGLRACGFGRELFLPWPGGSLPATGSAVARTELDHRIRNLALCAGASAISGARAVAVRQESGRVKSVLFAIGEEKVEISCDRLIVADGAKSQLGRLLGRSWHQKTVFGVAIRGYAASARSTDPWINSHLELRDERGSLLSGYGWVFPLGNGKVNLGVGTLATAARPAKIQLRPLLHHYASARQKEWELDGEIHLARSALLPMGGAVSGIAGQNWALIGDAAGCVNPLNGEGIDYGLETGRLIVDLMHESDWTNAWPATLRQNYGMAFSIARRLAGLLTVPGFLPKTGPLGMRSHSLMTLALRLMGNLVLDSDVDTVARLWRGAGRLSSRFDSPAPFPAADLRTELAKTRA